MYVKCNQYRPGFEPVSPCSFPTAITTTPQAPPYHGHLPWYGRAKAGRPARTYIQQLCEDTGCSPEDQPEAMNDREKWRERVRDIRAGGTTHDDDCWWWGLCEKWCFVAENLLSPTLIVFSVFIVDSVEINRRHYFQSTHILFIAIENA